LKSPKGVIITNDVRRTDGSHKVEIYDPQNGPGDYVFCFDNTFSYTTKKRVFFEIFLLDKDGNYLNDYDMNVLSNDQKYTAEHQLSSFYRITAKLKNNLNEVERMQSQHRALEARDRSVMEAMSERVDFWSIIHLLTLLFAAAVQVYTVRSLFLDDSYIKKFIR